MNRNAASYYDTYAHFEADVNARVRRKTFGEDIGQNSWTTADEYRRWAEWHDLEERSRVLLASQRRLSRIAYLAMKEEQR